MAKHTTDTMSFKVRTAKVRTEYTGSLDQGIEIAFYSVSTPERRAALIAKLHEADAKLAQSEAEQVAAPSAPAAP